MASSKKTRARRRPGDFLQFLAFSVIAGFLAAIIVVPPAVSARYGRERVDVMVPGPS